MAATMMVGVSSRSSRSLRLSESISLAQGGGGAGASGMRRAGSQGVKAAYVSPQDIEGTETSAVPKQIPAAAATARKGEIRPSGDGDGDDAGDEDEGALPGQPIGSPVPPPAAAGKPEVHGRSARSRASILRRSSAAHPEDSSSAKRKAGERRRHTHWGEAAGTGGGVDVTTSAVVGGLVEDAGSALFQLDPEINEREWIKTIERRR